MNLSSLSFFDLASERMTWLTARQQVISENIANADTPGFKARDVSSFGELVSTSRASGGLAKTHESHRGGSADLAGSIRKERDETAVKASISGNTVSLEEQAIRAAQTTDEYRLAAKLYQKGYQLMALAASGNK